jgi:hypothetical protein
MVALGDGRWAKELMLPTGEHQYRFLVDGEWITDPRAIQTLPNGFGTTNAVLKISKES